MPGESGSALLRARGISAPNAARRVKQVKQVKQQPKGDMGLKWESNVEIQWKSHVHGWLNCKMVDVPLQTVYRRLAVKQTGCGSPKKWVSHPKILT